MELLLAAFRLPRWVENFATRHGEAPLRVHDGALQGTAADGSTFVARLPFDTPYDGPPGVEAFVAALRVPEDWGVLLVRKGGFAVARLAGEEMTASKVGRRHVQGRTKAGGQSQQRFARRRENQARQAYEAAGDHAVRVLGDATLVVAGGDRRAVEEVLADHRLAGVQRTGWWLPVPDPRRRVLEAAVVDACSVRLEVTNAD